MQRLLPWVLAAAIGVAFAAQVFLRQRDAPQDGPGLAGERRETGGPFTVEPPSLKEVIYEPPSAELLRLRAEVARLRQETNRIAEEWQRGMSSMRTLSIELARLQPRNSQISGELFALRDMTKTIPRPPRVGAWLGIGIVDVKQPDSAPGTPEGVRVGSLLPNAPARPDLEYDDVITAIDGNPVPDVATFKAILATNHAGATFKFTVLRKGEIEVVEVGSSAWPQ